MSGPLGAPCLPALPKGCPPAPGPSFVRTPHLMGPPPQAGLPHPLPESRAESQPEVLSTGSEGRRRLRPGEWPLKVPRWGLGCRCGWGRGGGGSASKPPRPLSSWSPQGKWSHPSLCWGAKTKPSTPQMGKLSPYIIRVCGEDTAGHSNRSRVARQQGQGPSSGLSRSEQPCEFLLRAGPGKV